jgi:hypothetical protein
MKTLSIKSKKRTASILMLSLSLLLGCDNSFDELQKIAPVVPQVFLEGNPIIKTLIDSVKVGYVQSGSKNTYQPYQVSVNATSSGSADFSISALGEKQIKINGVPVPASHNFIFKDSTRFIYSIRPDTIGLYQVSFTVTDSKKDNDQATIKITAFDNLLPMAYFTFQYSDKTTDKHSFKLSAKQSFDRDAKFGGKIISYSWFIGGQIKETSTNELYATLSNGLYVVGLYVTDNDYGVSKLYSLLVLVQDNSLTMQ